MPNVPREIFGNIYNYYCTSLYGRCLTSAEYLHEIRNTQELFIRIRIFFMNCTTQKRRHTFSNNPVENWNVSSLSNSSAKTKKNRRNL